MAVIYRVLVLVLPVPILCGGTEYYVRPSEPSSASCPAHPCLTLSQYVNDSDHFFQSNTLFRFLPGTHLIKRSVTLTNVHNVSLLALERDRIPQVVTYIACSCPQQHCDPCTGLAFQNASHITIDSITIILHLHQQSKQGSLSVVGLSFTKTVHLKIQQMYGWMTRNGRVFIGLERSNDIELHSLTIGNGGLSATQSDRVSITNVTINNSTASGIDLQLTIKFVLNNIVIMYSKGTAINIFGASSTIISNTIIHFSGGAGIDITTSSNTRMINVSVFSSRGRGISMLNGRKYLINNTTVMNSQSHNMFLRKTTNTVINNSVTMYSTIDNGIEIYRAMYIKITNTVIANSAQHGIRVIMSHAISLISVMVKEWRDTGIRVYESLGVYLQNTSLVLNGTNTFDSQVIQSGIFVSKCSNITITASVFANLPSLWITNDINRQPAVLVLYNSNNSYVINCSFERNGITALKVVSSQLTVNGFLNFTSNRAYRGAAMVFIQGSKLVLFQGSHVICENNYADTTGGAIYTTSGVYGSSRYPYDRVTVYSDCFLEVKGDYFQNQLIFENNFAGQGGDILYGGSLGSACNEHDQSRCDSCLFKFQDISSMKNATLSKIASDPSRVCLCTNGRPDCLRVSSAAPNNGHGLYPGQTMIVSAVVVGQNFGTVAGSVFAQLLKSPSKTNTPQLGPGQDTQSVEQYNCNTLHYTIFSQVEEVVLMLTAVNMKATYSVTKKSVSEATKSYISFQNNKGPFPQDLLEFPVYVNISLLPCPPGFTLADKQQTKCDCVKQLNDLPGTVCDIHENTIHRSGLVWVGPLRTNSSYTDNDTVIEIVEVASARYCPLDYCKLDLVRVSLHQPDSQCNYGHSGTVCGGCHPGLSLALGSAQCLKCSNKYLALLIPLTLAGFVLVFFIKTLDVTISQGLINGLVFYANILKPNEHFFLPQTNINPLTLFIAWLNLDLGIETCFVDGLTAYWKTWLQFVFPFYIWAIAGLIIISARHSTRLARVMGNNSVPVLATLFLLSYAKLLRTIITIMSYTVVDIPHGQKTVWSADGNIDYLGPEHAPLFVAGIATLLFLWLPYTLLLLLGQWLRKINHHYVTHALMKMKPFLDAHYGPLKDSHHYWFGFLLFVRVIILLISAVVPANNFSVFTLSMAIATGVLISYTSIRSAVYHNNIVSIFEISLFINLGLLALAKFYTSSAGGDQTAATYTLIGVAFIQFLGLVSFKIYHGFKPRFSCYHSHKDDEEAEGVWRYDTPLDMWGVPQKTTPYKNAATAL